MHAAKVLQCAVMHLPFVLVSGNDGLPHKDARPTDLTRSANAAHRPSIWPLRLSLIDIVGQGALN